MRFMDRLGRMLSPRSGSAPFAPVSPAEPFQVIGDVHGRHDLLVDLLARLDPDLPVVLVGDVIDRGPDSAAVLRVLADRPDLVCLRGNHEEMLLDFLADPPGKGRRWLRYGGLQTVASFGVRGVTATMDADGLTRLARDLTAAMGDDMRAWVEALPALYQSGNVAVVHAGADPARPLAEQSRRSFVWGHPAFDRTRRQDGIWVIHGHTVVTEPRIAEGRVAIDTGAYATGRLTAARIDDTGIRFLS